MKRILKHTLTSAALAAVVASPLAHATNGYFKIGYGSKNRGLAGTGMAFGQDTLAPAVNPATLTGVFVGGDDRVDFGVELFKPQQGCGGCEQSGHSRSRCRPPPRATVQ